MRTYTDIGVEKHGHVGLIEIRRPPLNFFNVSLINVDSGTLLFPRTTLVLILDDENPVVEPSNPPQTSPEASRIGTAMPPAPIVGRTFSIARTISCSIGCGS